MSTGRVFNDSAPIFPAERANSRDRFPEPETVAICLYALSRCRLSQKVDASEAISKMAGLDGEGGRWDEFDIAAEAFQEMVEEQKESLKGVLEEEVMELNQVRRQRLVPTSFSTSTITHR